SNFPSLPRKFPCRRGNFSSLTRNLPSQRGIFLLGRFFLYQLFEEIEPQRMDVEAFYQAPYFASGFEKYFFKFLANLDRRLQAVGNKRRRKCQRFFKAFGG